MKILLNGEHRVVDPGATVADLLPDPTGHAVAVNDEVLPRSEHDLRLLEGDVVEIVTAVQGG